MTQPDEVAQMVERLRELFPEERWWTPLAENLHAAAADLLSRMARENETLTKAESRWRGACKETMDAIGLKDSEDLLAPAVRKCVEVADAARADVERLQRELAEVNKRRDKAGASRTLALRAERDALRSRLEAAEALLVAASCNQGEAREMLSELSDYAHGVRGEALVLTLDHIDGWQKKLRVFAPAQRPAAEEQGT
jgi:hypothetical protein